MPTRPPGRTTRSVDGRPDEVGQGTSDEEGERIAADEALVRAQGAEVGHPGAEDVFDESGESEPDVNNLLPLPVLLPLIGAGLALVAEPPTARPSGSSRPW